MSEGRDLAFWMKYHHAPLADLVRAEGFDWSDAATMFAMIGLRDLHGRLPTAASAKATWRQVHNEHRTATVERALAWH